MDDLHRVSSHLSEDYLDLARLKGRLTALLESDRQPADKQERKGRLDQEIQWLEDKIRQQLEDFAHFPHWHVRHAPMLADFERKGKYETSVFIMTKYPDPTNPAVADPQLRRVVDAVSAAVTANNHVPRIASDRDYHARLWDNVELHMLGCRRGIAIVEDKVKSELNPNVAMEWGWMLGLNRDVLYLVEKDFKQERADWKGLIRYEFDWADPDQSIRDAVAKFLQG
jgi:hypothetical protein